MYVFYVHTLYNTNESRLFSHKCKNVNLNVKDMCLIYRSSMYNVSLHANTIEYSDTFSLADSLYRV